jgi:hypothetical protein
MEIHECQWCKKVIAKGDTCADCQESEKEITPEKLKQHAEAEAKRQKAKKDKGE